jgi:LytS/YehU family sensor histidine kinase
MEAMRFDNHFTYKIMVSPELNTSRIKLPPLIIQPYVENAVWHGLMHKEEKGELEIEVAQEANSLLIKITDNGIGREQAARIASKSATKHKSMGLLITADRIAMIQSNNGNESAVIINDLVHVDGSAAGTEVRIKIPVIYD